ncbi:MAG: inner membrane CreD family protein [Acidobacteria bacterium]|nr:inner membrane CreD family protein [Acidobacteriota bacterium]MBV9147194.1 inner membrane CreD family protein [Acidobacteriota bacterium]
MTKRIAAIAFIWICTAIAWCILAQTIQSRTYSSDEKLQTKVASTWGTHQEQSPPSAYFNKVEYKDVPVDNGKKITMRRDSYTAHYELPLTATRVDVGLNLSHRQKGLLWYSTYAVAFDGTYNFPNGSNEDQTVTFRLPFPAQQAMYDDLRMDVNGAPVIISTDSAGVSGEAQVRAGTTAIVHVGYRSQGMDSWQYKFGNDVAEARNFLLNMKTNFKDIDFAANTLSPTEKHETKQGWELTWKYVNLVSGFQIGMSMPEKLQPGPLAGEISYFAPVSLLFFFFLMFILTTLKNIELHPMNYFFLAAAFFAFHLLLAYLVDHISIHLAFVICSAVSIFLVVSYLRLVIGMRFAALEAGMAQLVYLVLFSYAFFFKGFTGLAITIGAIVTLFVTMQVTGRIKWADKFSAVTLPSQRLATNTGAPAQREDWLR